MRMSTILVMLLLLPMTLFAQDVPGAIQVDDKPLTITADNVYPFSLQDVRAEIISAPRWLVFDNYEYQLGTMAKHAERTFEWECRLVDEANGQTGIVEIAFRDASGNVFDYQLIPVKVAQTSEPLLVNIFPNPANPDATIQYQLQTPADVRVAVYNMLGQHVRTLFDGIQQTGAYRLQWNGTDDRDVQMSSGIYFVKIVAYETADKIHQHTSKILLQK